MLAYVYNYLFENGHTFYQKYIKKKKEKWWVQGTINFILATYNFFSTIHCWHYNTF